MNPSFYFGAGPVKFINYHRFASELMKIEVMPDDFRYYRYAVPSFPWGSLLKATSEESTPSIDSFHKIHEVTLKRLFSFHRNVALLFGIDGPAAATGHEYTFKFGDMIQNLDRIHMRACRDFYRAPDYFVRISPRTWMLTRLEDWRLIINDSRTKYVYINTYPERSSVINIRREPGVSLFPRYIGKRSYART